jgi:hypothetical protein
VILVGESDHSLKQAVTIPPVLKNGLLSGNNNILSPATGPGPEQLLNQSTKQAVIARRLLS